MAKKPKPHKLDTTEWWKEAVFGLSPRALRERKKDVDKMIDKQVKMSGSTRRKA